MSHPSSPPDYYSRPSTATGSSSSSSVHASHAPSTSFESRRPLRTNRESQFSFKHGHKHHNYGSEKAPYPVSYDKDVIDMDAADQFMRRSVQPSPTLLSPPHGPPKMVLDLGCGSGTWTIDAAGAWPDTEFVGYDLVNIQIPLSILEPSVARRITWQHGNFLSMKLPFDDDTFDHVHVVYIGRGVPENKWSSLFKEIHRVLQPGGFVEVLEDDIIFPVLPRWFTEPLHAKPQAVQATNGTNTAPPSPPLTPVKESTHEHALLELLFNSVYQTRFINRKPTAVLPVYFTSFFSRCLTAQSLNLNMPYLAPLPPLPEQPSPAFEEAARRGSTSSQSTSPTRPPSQNLSMLTASFGASPTRSTTTLSTISSTDISNYLSFAWTTDEFGANATTPTMGRSPMNETLPELSPTEDSSSPSSITYDRRGSAPWVTSEDGTTLDSTLSAQSLIPFNAIEQLSDRTRAMNLYRAFMGVLGCREAMWEELLYLQSSRRERLIELGWEDKELEEHEARSRFEEMFKRYESDIHARVALWYSLSELGYPVPPRGGLTKSELLEEERTRKAIMDARAMAKEDDFDTPCRVLRVFIGFKSGDVDDGLFSDHDD
ncbi:S-adenosyl-L-methionine-dependent methyltransferase [Dentipellis sp. KUC8613]|nr:S-adenosyl-L-methionine-dependent methyltransferase [Dentipellis sp. KUC8613]